MSKNLKDIVEEGFSKLSALASKRQEILLRCEGLAAGSKSESAKAGVTRIDSVESSYKSDITGHFERSEQVLQQTLTQIVEDNDRFLASVKEHLQLRISRMIKELKHSKDWTVAGASESFESVVRPFEREQEAGATDLKFEALKLLGELESYCKRSQSSLHEAQAEIAGKLSSREHELSGQLGTDFNTIVQDAERRRHQVRQSLEQLYSLQTEQLASLTEELNERLSTAVKDSIHSVKEMFKETESSLGTTREEVVNKAVTDIVAFSQESFSELESSYEFSHQELSEKLAELRAQSTDQLKQVKSFLADLEANVRQRGDAAFNEIKEKPEKSAENAKSPKGPIEELMYDLSKQLDGTSAEFKNQVADLMRIQFERLQNLCVSTEGAFSASAQALSTELKQISRMHQHSWTEREQDILKRISKLEKETSETLAVVAGQTDDGTTAGEGV